MTLIGTERYCCPININLMFKDSAFGSVKATQFY